MPRCLTPPPLHRTTLLLCTTLLLSTAGHAISCPVAKPHTPTDAQQAFLKGHFDQAASLYQAQLQTQPHDPDTVAALTRVLLRLDTQEKLAQAADLVQKELATTPANPTLLTAQAEVQFRQGKPWLAAATATKATQLDPCAPRVHLLNANLLRLNSQYASAARELTTAHALDPSDPAIRFRWLQTLPLQQRIRELQAYLATDTGNDPDELRHQQSYLSFLGKELTEPHKACRLVSTVAATEIKFERLMRDATHLRAYGLAVKLNDRDARLQIDTGNSGLFISRAVADRAGLKRFSNTQTGGVGDAGESTAYIAYADSIKIGALQFHDCEVEVSDKKNILDTDGLIGMDVFSRFLVTLDYPMRKLVLGPLPPRPDDTVSSQPALQTAQTDDEEPTAAQPDTPPARPEAPAAPKTSRLHDRYVAPEMKDWTRVYRVGHMLITPAILNDKTTRLFVLDTGAFADTISPAVAREVTGVHADDTMTIHGVSGKVEKVYLADHIVFKFGNISQEARGVVAFESPSISKHVGMETAGFIGIDTLGQLTMTIDYRDALIHFSYDPNRGYRFQ